MYSAKELCQLLNLNVNENNIRNINQYLRKHNIKLPYPYISDYNSRIIEKYKKEISQWWSNKELSNAIQYKLKHNLVINYADKDRKCHRYVISIKCHPRASSGHQVKAHIILWELHNKRLFPENHVLIPKDGNFLNLDINNFDIMLLEDYRALVASCKRNHFYTLGTKVGASYKGGWKSISNKLIKKICKCAFCGNTNKYTLNMHHIISYYLFDKPKEAHFEDNLICLCDFCHQKLHSNSINLSGILSEKIKQKLLELLETLKDKFKNTEKILLVNFSIKSISSQDS